MGVPVVCNVDAHYTSSKCISDNRPNDGVSSLNMDCVYCKHKIRNS